MKKQILILISHFLPGNKIGGPLASNINIINSLSNNFNFSIITSCHDIGEEIPYKNEILHTWVKKDNYIIYYLPTGIKKAFRLFNLLKKSKSEIIYLNSFFDLQFSIFVVIIFKLGLIKRRQLIIAPRGEFVEGCMNFKPLRKRAYLKFANFFGLYKSVFFHASTENEKREIIYWLKIKPNDVKVALNIPSVGDELKKEEINTHPTETELNLIFLSRISKEKNLPFAIELVSKVRRNVNFDIYGPKEDLEVWHKCEELIRKMPSNIIVSYKGSIPRELVRPTFLKYDIFLFPSVGENFGHVIIESLLAGTKVLISNTTPWRNLEKDSLGWDLELSNPIHFIEKIENFQKINDLELNYENRKYIRSSILKRLQIENIVSNYNNLFF